MDPLLLAPADPAHFPLLQPTARAISAAAPCRPSRRAAAHHQNRAARCQVPARPPVDFATTVKGVTGVARVVGVVGVAGEAAAMPLHQPDRSLPAVPNLPPHTRPASRSSPVARVRFTGCGWCEFKWQQLPPPPHLIPPPRVINTARRPHVSARSSRVARYRRPYCAACVVSRTFTAVLCHPYLSVRPCLPCLPLRSSSFRLCPCSLRSCPVLPLLARSARADLFCPCCLVLLVLPSCSRAAPFSPCCPVLPVLSRPARAAPFCPCCPLILPLLSPVILPVILLVLLPVILPVILPMLLPVPEPYCPCPAMSPIAVRVLPAPSVARAARSSLCPPVPHPCFSCCPCFPVQSVPHPCYPYQSMPNPCCPCVFPVLAPCPCPCFPSVSSVVPRPYHPCCLYPVVPRPFHPCCPYPVVPHPFHPCCPYLVEFQGGRPPCEDPCRNYYKWGRGWRKEGGEGVRF
ncbi:unnamed protein product [Closterium sp. NIES-65]|nr:unnamed protein product [Closterium sp. NIES-65]